MIETVSCFELNVKLKQMTPIIHFQAEDYHGATLRASELRPKLDAFLIKYAFGSDAKQYEKYLVGYSKKGPKPEHKALDYRVATEAKADPKINEKCELGYLNRGGRWIPWGAQIVIGEDDHDRGRLSKVPVDANIRSMHTELIEIVAEWLPAFFAVNNFGKRQNKGFGSFWLEKGSKREFVEALCKWSKIEAKHQRLALRDNKLELDAFIYYWRMTYEGVDYKAVLDKIRDVYNGMKGGAFSQRTKQLGFILKEYGPYTVRPRYIQLVGDKKAIKQELLQSIPSSEVVDDFKVNRCINYYDGEEITASNKTKKEYFRYSRAMLGLADHYDMIPALRTQDISDETTTVNIKHMASTEKAEDSIDRFKSPITFKPVCYDIEDEKTEWIIIAIPHVVPSEMYNTNFEFSIEKNSSGLPKAINLSTPKNLSEFHLLKFLGEYFGAMGAKSLKSLAFSLSSGKAAKQNRTSGGRS